MRHVYIFLLVIIMLSSVFNRLLLLPHQCRLRRARTWGGTKATATFELPKLKVCLRALKATRIGFPKGWKKERKDADRLIRQFWALQHGVLEPSNLCYDSPVSAARGARGHGETPRQLQRSRCLS